MTVPLQACTPSVHVWSNLESPAIPQLLNQLPPRKQQLSLPDLAIAPHLGHVTEGTILAVVIFEVVSESVRALMKDKERR